MDNNKLNKTEIWKNFVGFGVLITIIFCIFFFNIKIGFTVFENIGIIPSFIVITISIIIIIIIILMVLLILNKIEKNRQVDE